MAQEYIPGVCNIGPAERRLRRTGGIIGAVATVALLILLLVTDAPYLWRLILIIPAAGSASGFLQYYMHFCARFGVMGIYNIVSSAGSTESVELKEFRLKDRNKALQIALYSLAIGFAVAALSLLIP